MTGTRDGLLRPEARPANWDELDDSQRDAIARVLRFLRSAIEDLRDLHPPRSRIPWVDRDRVSRLAFLSGRRGTGKTTVLVSLAQAVNDGKFELGEPTEAVKGLLATLSRSVVWLEPIDAEPATDQMNLLAAIVARIERAAEAYGPHRDELIARYAERSGRSTRGMRFYQAFAYYKLAIIAQGIARRVRAGQINLQRREEFGDSVSRIAAAGIAVAEA